MTLAGLAILSLLVGCDGSAGAQPHFGQTIKIGLNLETSGNLAWYGGAALKGAQIAIDAANASGGIGGACAETLARAGYTVLLHGCHGLEHAKALADRLCAEGCDAHAVCCDLADSESAQAMCRDILALYHRVDALVLCAGVSHTGLFCDMTDEQWRTVMDVNVSGMFYLIRALAPGMIARNEGAIVTVSSMWGRVGASCEVAYSASKAAVIGLTRALAKELGPSGVRVNCIAPGVIDTRMMDEHSDETKAALAEETPLCRLGTPQDVAGACAFLLSDAAAFITGQVLGVDGGYI